jgi:hypothetical protein
MARDDSILNTGMSSSLSRRVHAEQTKKKQQKHSLKTQVKPVEGLLMEAIKAEKNALKDELAALPLNYETKEGSIKSYLLAQQMHIRFLDRFQTNMLNRLRIQKDQDNE